MAKFKTLTHNGVIFPDEYERCGSPLLEKFSSLAEEMLWHWAAKKETEYVQDKVVIKNFWKCLKPELPKEWQAKKFPEDFSEIINELFNINQIKKDEKAVWRKEHKAEIEAEKEAKKEKYGYAMLNGQKQARDLYQIEGPGIILTRGASPIKGLWKYRTVPEDVTINFVGPKEQIPQAPEGHKWKEVISNKNAFETFFYNVDVGHVTERFKKGRFGATSDVNQNADKEKYEKAQQLAKDWNEIIEQFISDTKDEDAVKKQCAIISYLISVTAIRIGNEKDLTIEADTVGMSTLKKSNMTVDGNVLKLNFLGKDSVTYKNSVEIEQNVADALSEQLLKIGKNDKVFSVTSGDVNTYMKTIREYMTPKLFRTAQATMLLANELQHSSAKKGMPQWQIKAIYDQACLAVSKKLNHQKNISKNFDAQMDKTNERLSTAKDKAKERKAKGVEQLKKIQKDIKTAKAVYKGERLEAKLEQLRERKEKIKAQVERAEERVEKLKVGKEFKQDTRNFALGTAKTAYSSPKVAYSFCKDMGVDISIVYTKTVQKKFEWAENTPSTFWKKYPNV